MKIKILAFSLMLTLFLASVPLVSATANTQTGDWSLLKNHLNEQVAVKTKNQKTVYGILREVTDGELKITTVGKNSSNEILLNRAEVEKIWLARLKAGRNTGKGAAIGAGVAAGIGLALALSANREDSDGLAGAAVPLFALYGAGIGGVVGFFTRQKHKKEKLIYRS